MSARDIARWAVVVALSLLAFWVAGGAEEPGGASAADDSEESVDEELNVEALSAAPPLRSPAFQAPVLPPQPPPGKGRLNLAVGGNRQWCTYRDDRVVKPPPSVGSTEVRPRAHNPIYTFGYQFTIAAVARAKPTETMMLFESPVIRTAVLRQAAKLGRGGKKPPGPTLVVPQDGKRRVARVSEQPGSLVPYWQEPYACATLPEAFDFDLEPGAYDVYMAFDVLNASGSWAHRSIGYLTDVVIAEGRRTRLEGRVDMVGGGQRQVDLLGSALLPAAEAGAGAAP